MGVLVDVVTAPPVEVTELGRMGCVGRASRNAAAHGVARRSSIAPAGGGSSRSAVRGVLSVVCSATIPRAGGVWEVAMVRHSGG